MLVIERVEAVTVVLSVVDGSSVVYIHADWRGQ
jgi:hypothetical protein